MITQKIASNVSILEVLDDVKAEERCVYVCFERQKFCIRK